MARARAATAQMLKSIAWDVRNVPDVHPLRTENDIFNMQIADLADVVDHHLKGSVLFI
jgi:hypothetical protein